MGAELPRPVLTHAGARTAMQAAKSQHILCILLLNYFWLNKTYPLKILMACGGVTLGFLINAFAEADLVRTVLGL